MSWQKFEAGIRSPATLELYTNRMRAFLTYSKTTDDKFSRLSAEQAEEIVAKYISHLKTRVSKGEIAPGTVSMSVAPIQLFSVMNRMRLDWKYVSRQVPTSKKYASDRAPTLEEIRQLLLHVPLRMKAAVLMLASGGFRVGAFEGMKVRDLIELEGEVAKVVVYRGDSEEQFCFITPEANGALNDYLNFRRIHGELITPDSPLMRDAFDTRGGGNAKEVRAISAEGIERDIVRLWWKSGARTQVKRRHEFKSSHGFRKFFKTRAEQVMKPINVEILMGHSVGVSNSYYKPREAELLEDYLKAVPHLSIGEEYKLKEEFAAEKAQLRAQFQAELDQRLGKIENEMRELQLQRAVASAR